ncbi:VOC family protein [Lederbergia citrea]|uniref:VOC family protein n=1 Tax=Lederbergia citrea TaxID=2833581 RepID=A0A942UVV2_9BACI|nr:VOC family protein [Lederbergia citrea]MBS4177684.1 VOC family protein [Lederbergia citrea]MBS4204361.1 VOC family protein [Lederbergia citrea]MBS4223794.1 VOC family protein [Lederbergia citrea]
MQKIVPHLWYDKEAKEAALFYISLFEKSKLLNETVIENTPSGDSELVSFELAGQEFMAISAGPYFKFNPSVSLMVACESVEEVNTKWKALIEGGTELMPLGEYPFSTWFGWIQDRFGLSWQLTLTDNGQAVQKITPHLLFSSDSCGKAEEAIKYYTEVFDDSKLGLISKYGAGEAMSLKAKVKYADFKLGGMHFSAMDHGFDVDFNFNEAFSLMINCKDQIEIDYFWDRLSAVPEAEQCGWIKDKFGLSWQIVPDNMNEVLYKGSKDENRRVFEALLKMKKIDLNALEIARFENDKKV